MLSMILGSRYSQLYLPFIQISFFCARLSLRNSLTSLSFPLNRGNFLINEFMNPITYEYYFFTATRQME